MGVSSVILHFLHKGLDPGEGSADILSCYDVEAFDGIDGLVVFVGVAATQALDLHQHAFAACDYPHLIISLQLFCDSERFAHSFDLRLV